MAKMKFRFNATVGVPDLSKSQDEVRSPEGFVLVPATVGIRYVPPGEAVELEEEEGMKIGAAFGFYDGVPATKTMSGPGTNTVRKAIV